MIKLQFGCGGNRLDGWYNYDADVDITKPLPFNDNFADRIFAEHVVEHTDSKEAFGFFKECYRVLKKDGRIRICVPSIERIYMMADQEYLQWLGGSGFGQSNKQSAVENLMVNHGHKTAWSENLLKAALYGVGFDKFMVPTVGFSTDEHFQNVEGHWKVIGKHPAFIESIVVEASK